MPVSYTHLDVYKRQDETGAVSATGVQTLGALNWFSDGLMPLISAENNLYGYVDASGQWAIRPQFAYAGPFIEGRALASLTTGYGLIEDVYKRQPHDHRQDETV